MAYSYHRSITIDHTKVGATDSSNWPLGIIGTYTWLKTVANAGRVQSSSGYDIQFYSDASLTTALTFERRNWDGTTGAVEFWVKIPTLSHTVDTVIYIAYGDASISTDQQDSANTWDANYLAVYHGEDGVDTSHIHDSTTNGRHLTKQGAANPAITTTAKIGNAQSFNGSTSYASIASFMHGLTKFTVEAWVYLSGNQTGKTYWSQYEAPNGWVTGISDSTQNVIKFYHSGGTLYSTNPLSLTTFTHVVITHDNAATPASYIYIGGAADTNDTGNPTYAGVSGNNYLGSLDNVPNQTFNGILDEIRLSDIVRGADWITANYNNQNSPSTFYTVGNELLKGYAHSFGTFIF